MSRKALLRRRDEVSSLVQPFRTWERSCTPLCAARLQGLAPGAVLGYVNTTLAASNHESMFVTLWEGIFDPSTGILEYANGGHCTHILWRNGENTVQELEVISGPLLGMLEDADYTEDKGASIRLRTRDVCPCKPRKPLSRQPRKR